MNQESLFAIKKFNLDQSQRKPVAVFFTDRKKITDFEKIIKTLPKNSAIIIREYDLEKKDREIFAKKIINLARPQGLKILIGKDISLAKKVKADGIHFSDFDKLPLIFLKRESFTKKFLFSFACHSLKSVLKAKKLKADMVFISPIFATTSHVGQKTIGLKHLAKFAFNSKNSNYLYALGGINKINIKAITKLNLGGFGAIEFFKNL